MFVGELKGVDFPITSFPLASATGRVEGQVAEEARQTPEGQSRDACKRPLVSEPELVEAEVRGDGYRFTEVRQTPLVGSGAPPTTEGAVIPNKPTLPAKRSSAAIGESPFRVNSSPFSEEGKDGHDRESLDIPQDKVLLATSWSYSTIVR
jgi:hypothetical protein